MCLKGVFLLLATGSRQSGRWWCSVKMQTPESDSPGLGLGVCILCRQPGLQGCLKPEGSSPLNPGGPAGRSRWAAQAD